MKKIKGIFRYSFLPYNHIFDMTKLKSMKLKLNNSIVLIDEGHNFQDACCD